MNSGLGLLAMYLSGAVLGAGYFAGLWLTTQRLQQSHPPALLLITSLLLRTLFLLTGFYFILGDGQWQHLLTALAGLITLRQLTLYCTRKNSLAGRRAPASTRRNRHDHQS